mgnify:CR=1 FL=1
MLIGRVIGNVVATKKNLKLDGEKLLLVQPLELSGAAKGAPIIAIDRMNAGSKDRVLYTQDGRTAQQILGRGTAGVDAAIFYQITKDIEAQVNVENIFGADYFPTAHSDNNIAPGAPTNVKAAIRFGF